MKILVTGGAGFIGSHTVDALIEAGHDVLIVDNLEKTVHPKGKPDHIHPAADVMWGDVRDKQTWVKALQGVEAVYHLAAYQDYLTDFSTYFHTNAVSTALLYEVLVQTKAEKRIRKVIVAASQAVMGEGRYCCPKCRSDQRPHVYPAIRLESQLAKGHWDHGCEACGQRLQWLPSDETVVNPCNQYALSKHSQEQIAIQLGRRYGIPSVVMRYSIVQGPRQSFYNAYSGAMRIFALSLLLDREPIIYEDGQQVRDYVNIEDVVAANLLVLQQPAADYSVFNVGGGKAWTVMDFYECMQTEVAKTITPRKGDYYRYGDTRHIFSDTRKLEALGWRPRRGISDSIRAYWDYLCRQQAMDDILAYAEAHMKNQNVIRRVHPIP